MDPAKLRAWWWQRQGLDGSLAGQPAAEVLERSGWAPFPFSFHDDEEIGPRMLAHIAKRTGLTPKDV